MNHLRGEWPIREELKFSLQSRGATAMHSLGCPGDATVRFGQRELDGPNMFRLGVFTVVEF